MIRFLRIGLVFPLLMGWVLIHACQKKDADKASGNQAERGLPENVTSRKGGEKMMVKEGDKVQVSYTGKLNDGTVFDTSDPQKPLEFTVGRGQIIPGLDQAVKGMKVDEEKKVTIKPEDAFGDRDETLLKEFPKSSLPADFEVEKGMVIQMQDQQGKPVPATVKEIGEENLTIDLNHPLAGEELTFKITIVNIQ